MKKKIGLMIGLKYQRGEETVEYKTYQPHEKCPLDNCPAHGRQLLHGHFTLSNSETSLTSLPYTTALMAKGGLEMMILMAELTLPAEKKAELEQKVDNELPEEPRAGNRLAN